MFPALNGSKYQASAHVYDPSCSASPSGGGRQPKSHHSVVTGFTTTTPWPFRVPPPPPPPPPLLLLLCRAGVALETTPPGFVCQLL